MGRFLPPSGCTVLVAYYDNNHSHAVTVPGVGFKVANSNQYDVFMKTRKQSNTKTGRAFEVFTNY